MTASAVGVFGSEKWADEIADLLAEAGLSVDVDVVPRHNWKAATRLRWGPDYVCPHCFNVWPRTPTYFYHNPRMTDGLSSWCKSCFVERTRQTRRKSAA